MCLAVPGEVKAVTPDPLGLTMGRVRFGGVVRDVCLAYVPAVRVGDYVLVHAGFALVQVEEADALRTCAVLAGEGPFEGGGVPGGGRGT